MMFQKPVLHIEDVNPMLFNYVEELTEIKVDCIVTEIFCNASRFPNSYYNHESSKTCLLVKCGSVVRHTLLLTICNFWSILSPCLQTQFCLTKFFLVALPETSSEMGPKNQFFEWVYLER